MQRYLWVVAALLMTSCEVTMEKKPLITVAEKKPAAAEDPVTTPTVYQLKIRHSDAENAKTSKLAGDYWVQSTRVSHLSGDEVAKLFAPLPAESIKLLERPPSPPASELHEMVPELITKSYGTIDARLVHVHDGDTIVVDVPLWPAIIGDSIPVRLNGYDAPELRSKTHGDLARKAKERMIELTATRRVMLTSLRRDKYFRINAGIVCEGVDIATTLAAEGLIKPYTGQGPKPWEELP